MRRYFAALFFALVVSAGCLAAPSTDCCEDGVGWPVKINILGWKICAFDISGEFTYMTRHSCSRGVDVSSSGIDGDLVLDTEFPSEWNIGSRTKLEAINSQCDRIELIYTSLPCLSSSKKFSSSHNDLYSIFSDFGDKRGDIFRDVDKASSHKLSFGSQFYTLEANYRNHLTIFEIPDCYCIDGSMLYGYRYLNVEESLTLKSKTILGKMKDKVHLDNSCHGAQIGADIWFPLIRRLDLGIEAKGLALLNHSRQRTKISADSLAENIREGKEKNRLAWGLEASLKMCYELRRECYLRLGYQALFLRKMAVVEKNFNGSNPFVNPPRSKKLSTHGALCFHGLIFGCDWCW